MASWSMAHYWFSARRLAEIPRSRRARCRVYAFYSLVRMVIAYLLSLAFAVGYGYFAAYNKRTGSAHARACWTSCNPFRC